MRDEERIDLEPLRPDAAQRDRVIGGAMARIRAQRRAGWAEVVLAGSAPLMRPVLAAAALIALFLVLPGDALHPDTRTAGVLLSQADDVPSEWLRWSLVGESPDPRAILVNYSEPLP